MLLKQHPAAIDKVVDTFYLSEGEKRFLLSAGIGEGLFFAGSNHVAIKVMASEEEHKLITTNPEEILKLRREREEQKQPQPVKAPRPVYRPYKTTEINEYTTFDKEGKVKPEFTPEVVNKLKVSPTKPPVSDTNKYPEFITKQVPNQDSVIKNTVTQKPQVPFSAVNKTIELKRKVTQNDEDYINSTPTAGDILDSVQQEIRMSRQVSENKQRNINKNVPNVQSSQNSPKPILNTPPVPNTPNTVATPNQDTPQIKPADK